jgi:hypothetical protein
MTSVRVGCLLERLNGKSQFLGLAIFGNCPWTIACGCGHLTEDKLFAIYRVIHSQFYNLYPCNTRIKLIFLFLYHIEHHLDSSVSECKFLPCITPLDFKLHCPSITRYHPQEKFAIVKNVSSYIDLYLCQ